MIAILRFLWLKGRRDSTIVGFTFVPAVIPLAACLGVTLSARHFTYPMYLNAGSTPADNAALACTISMFMAILFGGIASFWALRGDIASRSVNAFVFGVRPAKIALTLIVFGTLNALIGWIGGVGMTWLVTSSLPPHLPMFALRAILGFIAGSAAGACAVALSPQPAMIIGAYVAGVFLAAFTERAGAAQWMPIAIALVGGVVCTAAAAFFLERRCAT